MAFNEGENRCTLCKHEGWLYSRRLRARVAICKSKSCSFQPKERKNDRARVRNHSGGN